MSTNPPGSPLEYPANGIIPTRIFRFARSPLTTDFRNFKIRDFWIDSSADTLYFLVNKSGTSATWILLAVGSADLESLTGDSGAAATPTAGNINIAGTAAQGLVTSSATDTVTLTVSDATETQKGVLETSTDVEAIAVTETDKALVPSNLTPLFASPPSIGGTIAANGTFTLLNVDNIQIDGNTISAASGSDLNITLGDAIGANNLIIQNSTPVTLANMNSNGWLTLPLQPSVLAYVTANVANVTGDGTVYTIIMDAERFDTNSDFDITTGVFTAPVTGKYSCVWNAAAGDFGAAHTEMNNTLTTSNATYQGFSVNPFVAQDVASTAMNTNGGAIFDMEVADTAFVTVQVSGGAQTVSNRGDAVNFGSRICIQLIS